MRLAAVAKAQADEVTSLRQAIGALEQRFTAEIEPMAVESFPEAGIEPPPIPASRPESLEPVIAKKVSAPAPPAAPPAPAPASQPEGSFELQFGRVWLVRLGIGLLVTGLVLLGNYAYQNWVRDLPAIVRLAALYLGSLLICGTGVHLAKRENLQRFGEVLLAGGLAFFYWCTFAAHHVPRLEVIGSPVAAGVLLLGAAGVIVAVSLRRDSRATAVMGLLLASYSTVLQPLGWLSAFSNVLLAGAGVALMLRRGWATPGIASMAGTYSAFLWWQLAGGSGSRPDDPAALWFLPPVWAIFALPGVLGISRRFDSLSERGRSWFAGANNAVFFMLFSLLWVKLQDGEGFWVVPGGFGLVLLALGIAGRSRDASGGVHLVQGLAALSLSMALKLEGYHLALGFAGEALALSLAFRRFGGKSELGFAVLATGGALYVSLIPSGLNADVPLWSRALVALLPMAAAFPLRAGGERFPAGTVMADRVRTATSFVLLGGGVLAWYFSCHHLPINWQAPATALIGLLFSIFVLRFDPARRWFEFAWLALVFTVSVLPGLFPAEHRLPGWSPMIAAGILMAAHFLWLKSRPGSDDSGGGLFPRPELLVWSTALVASVSVLGTIQALDLGAPGALLCLSGAALGLVFLGCRVGESPPLGVAAMLLFPQAIGYQIVLGEESRLLHFVPVAAALGIVALAGWKSLAGVLARIVAVLCWLIAWSRIAPESSADILALTGLGLAVVASRMKRTELPECWVFLGWAALRVLILVSGSAWERVEPAPFPHGGAVVASVLACGILMRPAGLQRKQLRQGLLYAACALLALWSSQVIVWHFNWKPVAILWTVLGFALVSSGLWGKIAALRHAGFALLTLSLAKLFVVDVWDFGAFTRVAAFLALGVALVVLGFFYNRFAEVLKKLFESDAA